MICKMENFRYCACIRTLGTAGNKYLQTLISLQKQTIPPEKILVYIAEGYELPKETIGIEQYVYVKKGMVAQRAVPYSEVDTEYVLLLDDDLSFPEGMVEKLAKELKSLEGDVISPNIYPNHKWSLFKKITYAISGGTFPMKSDRWAFKIRSNMSYCYNNNPKRDVYESQNAAGACSLWKLDALRGIKYEDEVYFDRFKYVFGDEQLFYHKAYLNGFKLLVDFNTGIKHLDGRSGRVEQNREREECYGLLEFLIWHRASYSHKGFLSVPHFLLKVLMKFSFKLAMFMKFGLKPAFWYMNGILKGIKESRTEEYKRMPPFVFTKNNG